MQRFIEGPTRPYADRAIADLVDLLDEAKKTQALLEEEHEPQTCRKSAIDQEIADLEERLGKTPRLSNYQATSGNRPIDSDMKHLLPKGSLPDDYKEFLRITNEFWSDLYQGQPDNPGNLFYGIEGIEASDDCVWVHNLDFTLFPTELTNVSDDDIALGDFTGFSVGAGGDEGSAILIPPSSVKKIHERFEKTYAVADNRDKRKLEREALDICGGIEFIVHPHERILESSSDHPRIHLGPKCHSGGQQPPDSTVDIDQKYLDDCTGTDPQHRTKRNAACGIQDTVCMAASERGSKTRQEETQSHLLAGRLPLRKVQPQTR